MYVYSNTVIDVKTLMWGLQARKQIHRVFIEDYFSPADEAASSSHSSISDPFDDCDLTSTFPPAQNNATQNELERYLAEYPESRNTNILLVGDRNSNNGHVLRKWLEIILLYRLPRFLQSRYSRRQAMFFLKDEVLEWNRRLWVRSCV